MMRWPTREIITLKYKVTETSFKTSEHIKCSSFSRISVTTACKVFPNSRHKS